MIGNIKLLASQASWRHKNNLWAWSIICQPAPTFTDH